MYRLNQKEKACLVTIARRTRIDYLEKNKYTYLEDDIDMLDEDIFISKDNVENDFEVKNDRKIDANKIEDVFRDFYVSKSAKALTFREKLVLFLYYWEEKTDEVIGNELNIKGDTIRKIRKRAINKISNKYHKLKGNDKNDF